MTTEVFELIETSKCDAHFAYAISMSNSNFGAQRRISLELPDFSIGAAMGGRPARCGVFATWILD
jgi:hypothetical protein